MASSRKLKNGSLPCASRSVTAWRGGRRYFFAAVMIVVATWRICVLLRYLVRGKRPIVGTENAVMIVVGIRGDPDNLKLRVAKAAAAAAPLASKDVILSGGSGARGPSEAKAMRDLWLQEQAAGITNNAISFFLEEESQDTAENAVYSVPILRSIIDKKKKRLPVIVVTNDFHAPRTKLIFEQIFDAYGLFNKKDGVARIDVLAAPTVPEEKRKKLLEKEWRFLNKKFLAGLMQNATGQPIRALSDTRIEQAREELRNLQ